MMVDLMSGLSFFLCKCSNFFLIDFASIILASCQFKSILRKTPRYLAVFISLFSVMVWMLLSCIRGILIGFGELESTIVFEESGITLIPMNSQKLLISCVILIPSL